MKKLDIKELSTDEVRERIVSERMNYNKMKLNHKISAIEKFSTIRDTRRLVARLITELWQRDQAAAKK
jgi:large subunit ribosomal protein L29